MTSETDLATSLEPSNPLAAARAEIDALDDALHDLVMQRAEVVARLAASRAKAGSPSPLRPGREAMILRRLLARHQGPLPPTALVRLWREILASSSAQQGGFTVAVYARSPDLDRLAREHFGSLTPLRSLPTASRALSAVAAGEAQVAVLPLPEEGEAPEDAWWMSLDSPRLQVIARLPFLATGPDSLPEALAIAPGAPDPSGADRSLLRIEAVGERSRAQLAGALTAAGLAPRLLQLRRDGGLLRALAEVDGVLEAGDPRLAALPVDRALPLGFYAVPERGVIG
ncbi:chorismate mutase [Belnapia rosea]|uniref:chorismate mutase n=1 Tax=Belnapia rosea TaxID=938405 RepID=UPI00088CA427|nr:chorismate mutase [Belnapia rosea]SDB61675.1 Chorismate mutase [Belnapia rosea]